MLSNLKAVLDRAAAVGVRRFVCNGATEADWPIVARLAQDHPEVVPAFGLHPWHIGERSDHWLRALEACLDAVPSAVGEVGLDRWIVDRQDPEQEQVFRAQIRLAKARNRPLMIHCLRAWGWLMEVLAQEAPLPAGFMLHAYGGAPDLIQPLANMGAYFSFAGSILQENKVRQQESLRRVPRDRLLLETDAPDILPPKPFRTHVMRDAAGKECNEPANLAAIARGVAGLLGETEDCLAQTVWDNSRRFLQTLVLP